MSKAATSLIPLVLLLVVAGGCARRRLPPYVRHGWSAAVAPRGPESEGDPSAPLPPPPTTEPLLLEDVATVGIRFEHAGTEHGPNGASQALPSQPFRAAEPVFFRRMDERARGLGARIGRATGDDDLDVLVVVFRFAVLPEHCETTSSRDCTTDSDGDEDCRTSYDTDCDWPIELFAEVHFTQRGRPATLRRFTLQGAADDALADGIDHLHAQLADQVAETLQRGGLR